MVENLTVRESAPKIIVAQASPPHLSIGQLGDEKLVVGQDTGEAISLSSVIQNLTISNPISRLAISDATSQTLIISDVGTNVVSTAFGKPYYQAEDAKYYYFSWQHTNGTQWEAQQFDGVSFDIVTLSGPNPQPATLTDFQALGW